MKEIDNQRDGSSDEQFDQVNRYDFAGRLKKNDVGPLSGSGHGSSSTEAMNYDAFSNLTFRSSAVYGFGDSFTESYENNRTDGDLHDSAGNVVKVAVFTSGGGRNYDDIKTWRFDAAGQMVYWDEHGPWGSQTTKHEEFVYDGDGRRVKRVDLEGAPHYSLVSSVTGQKITDLIAEDDNGQMVGIWEGGKVYLGDTVIHDTTFHGYDPNGTQQLYELGFTLTDPVSGSRQQVTGSGAIPVSNPTETPNYSYTRVELAGLGTAVPSQSPEAFPAPDYGSGGFAGNSKSGCVDGSGTPAPCNSQGYPLKKKPKSPKVPHEPPPHGPNASVNRGPSLSLFATFDDSAVQPTPPSTPCEAGQVLMLVEGKMQCVGAEPSTVEVKTDPEPGPVPEQSPNMNDMEAMRFWRCRQASYGSVSYPDCGEDVRFERKASFLWKNFTLPFKAQSGGDQNPYKPCDSFLGVNARYMHRNAGETVWGQEVRGMLIADLANGGEHSGAHFRAYLRASYRNPTDTPRGLVQAVSGAGGSLIQQTTPYVNYSVAPLVDGANNAMGLGYRTSSRTALPAAFPCMEVP